jgi:hypothetical protein
MRQFLVTLIAYRPEVPSGGFSVPCRSGGETSEWSLGVGSTSLETFSFSSVRLLPFIMGGTIHFGFPNRESAQRLVTRLRS